MKKNISFCLILIFVIVGLSSIDAKTTGGKKTTRSRQSSKTTVKKTNSSNLNGHEAVDLGLSVKWAKCNLGASSPYERGGFYRWTDSRDYACDIWGCSWRTPSSNEVQELYSKCRWEWRRCTYSDDTYSYCTHGYLITGPNGKQIFLPANGRQFKNNTNSL